jgi:type IV secretory pathway TrbL component
LIVSTFQYLIVIRVTLLFMHSAYQFQAPENYIFLPDWMMKVKFIMGSSRHAAQIGFV